MTKYLGPELKHKASLAELVGSPNRNLILQIDWDQRTIQYDCNFGVEGVPAAELHGHVKSWPIPVISKRDAKWLIEMISPLIDRAADGYGIKYDGSNHIATFTEKAQAAIKEIDDIIMDLVLDSQYDSRICGLYSAWDWYTGSPPPELSAETTDEELAKLIEKVQAEAHREGAHLYDLETYFNELRENERLTVTSW